MMPSTCRDPPRQGGTGGGDTVRAGSHYGDLLREISGGVMDCTSSTLRRMTICRLLSECGRQFDYSPTIPLGSNP